MQIWTNFKGVVLWTILITRNEITRIEMKTNQSKLCVKGPYNILTCLKSLILSSIGFLFIKVNILELSIG